MLNSSNYVRDEKVIRTGEVVASAMPNKPGAKTYYHQVPGACTFLPDGAQLVFSGGQYSTDNKELMAHLDAICDKPGTLVYSVKPGTVITKEAADLALEVAEPAGNASANTGSIRATPSAAAALVAQIAANKLKAAQAVDPALADQNS